MRLTRPRHAARRFLTGVLLTLIAGCSVQGPAPQPTTSASAPTPAPQPTTSASSPTPEFSRKVMIVAEENHGYDQIVGNRNAPYLNQLAAEYGAANDYDAGYPAHCPSLAAYILLTSGTTAGICDDKDPKDHPLTGDNIFHQVSASGREWRDYAEAEPGPCALTGHGRYLVRHVPA